MFDEAVTTILDALALCALAVGAAVLVIGPLRVGVALVVGGAVLLSSTAALGVLAGWAMRRRGPGGEGA